MTADPELDPGLDPGLDRRSNRPSAEAGPPGRGPALVVRGRRAGRRVVDLVLVEPVREGRLRDRDWPTGLRPAVLIALLLSVTMVVLTGLSGLLRRRSGLLFMAPDQSLPRVVVPILVAALIFALVLLYVGALHLRPLVKVPLLVVLCSILVGPAAVLGRPAFGAPLWLGAALLLIFAIARRRSAFRSFELVVSIIIIGGAVVYALLITNLLSGAELPSAAFGAFAEMTGTVWILAGPFAALAGATVTELLASIVIAASLAAGETIRLRTARLRTTRLGTTRPGRRARHEPDRRPVLIGLAILAAARIVQLSWAARTDDDYRIVSLSLGALPLVVPLVVLGLLIRHRSAVRWSTLTAEDGLGDWTRWALLASGLTIGVAVWPVLVADLLLSVGLDTWAVGINDLNVQLGYEISTPIAVAIVVVVTVREFRRSGRLSILLIGIGWLMAVREVFTLLGVLGSVPGALVAASAAAILIGAVLAARRTLTLERAIALASVLVLSGLYPFRSVITEPVTAVLALVGGSVGLMVGVLWRLLTDNSFSHGDSARFPRPNRVLLIMASALFGAAGVALLALQGGVSDTNLQLFEQLGDSQLGFTLVVIVLLLQLLAAIFGSPTGKETEAQIEPEEVEEVEDQPSQPLSVATRTASARDDAPSLPIADDR